MLRSIATENGLGDEHVERAAQASSVITYHGGYVFKMVGDAVYAAFAVPADAVSAALASYAASPSSSRIGAMYEMKIVPPTRRFRLMKD